MQSTFIFLILIYFLTLQYCTGFAIYRNESTTGLHVFPILNKVHLSGKKNDASTVVFRKMENFS